MSVTTAAASFASFLGDLHQKKRYHRIFLLSLDSSDLLFRVSSIEGVVEGGNDGSGVSSLLVMSFVGTVSGD